MNSLLNLVVFLICFHNCYSNMQQNADNCHSNLDDDTPPPPEYLSELSKYRTQIDAIDQILLNKLGERMQVSKNVGELKREYNVPIFQAGRTDEQFQKYKDVGLSLGLDENFVERIFKAIHEESINVQQKLE